MGQAAVDYFVYVQFPPFGTNENGKLYSIEPKKWMRVLNSGGSPDGLHHRIDAYGASEHPTSLNVKVRVRPQDLPEVLTKIAQAFTGAEQANIFNPTSETPEMVKVRGTLDTSFAERRRIA